MHAKLLQFSSVQFSRSGVSDCLRHHESQHARPFCSSPTPGVHSDSRPSSQWCHPAISSSVIPFSSCRQSLPSSVFSNESTLRMRWPEYWSFSFSIVPSKEIPGLISFSCLQLFVTLWTVGLQAPLSMGILQARTLPFSKGFSQPTDWTTISPIPCTGRQILYQ